MTTEFFSEKAYMYARWLTYCLMLSLPFTRILSGLNLVGITIIAWVFLLFHWDRKLIPKSLMYFTVIANCYFVLSFFKVFPQIWTTEFEVKAIPQQAFFVYSMLPIFYLFFTFIVYHLHSKQRLNQLFKLLVIVVIYSKIVQSFLDDFDFQVFFSVAGLGNISAFIILGMGLAIASTENLKHKYFLMLLFIFGSVYSPYSQNLVFLVLFLGVFILTKYSFPILLSFVFSTVVFYAIFIQNPMAVHFIDQNLTVRLVLIKDAIDGLIDSNFIGVGFGTESIKNYYPLFKNPIFHNQDNAGFIHLAVHNSFATISYRLGIIGFISFLVFLYEMLLAIKNTQKNKPVASVFFLCFYVVAFQNPALESFTYLVGCFLMLASIWALYLVEKQADKLNVH